MLLDVNHSLVRLSTIAIVIDLEKRAVKILLVDQSQFRDPDSLLVESR